MAPGAKRETTRERRNCVLACLVMALVVAAVVFVCEFQWAGRAPALRPVPNWGRLGSHTVYAPWPFDAAEARRRQRETAKALGVEVEQEIDLYGGLTLTMVLIPAGEFVMGSGPEEVIERRDTRRRVVISKPFWLSKCEVTQALWKGVVGGNPSRTKGDSNPVDRASWDEVQWFLRKLSARACGAGFVVPTEAQWEYACRAGTASPFHFGPAISAAQVNYDGGHPYGGAAKGASRGCTTPVGAFPANAWGLHDMHGNACEWCRDWYGPPATGKQTDPTGPATGTDRVVRGGSWYHSAGSCRSAYRRRQTPGERNVTVGIRVARPFP